ncbi:MAG: hypothetical protein M3Q10_02025 [Chloroflexota bacterium]|nr:hypothetical protein [Chloroflexota bacterium]
MGTDGGLSPHPVDRLVRELVRTRCPAGPGDAGRVIDRLANAPFDPRVIRTRLRERGIAYQGRSLGMHEASLFVHLVRRVVVDEQWSTGTSGEQYTNDLRAAARAPGSRLAVYARRGGHLVAAVAPAQEVVEATRRGPRFGPILLVVYSADRGIILTGYQVDEVESVPLPEDVRWLN